MIFLIEKYRHLIVATFFLFFFILGMLIFKDYGVHWDEYQNQQFGQQWTNYIYNVFKTGSFTKHVPLTIGDHDLTHGPFLEVSLTLLQNLLKLTDSRDIILLRHFSIFLIFFLGTVVFYFLCLRHFKNWKLALLGSLFLILSPRIFSHAFYNTVDIGFMVFFTLSMFTLVCFLDKKDWATASLHALTCALAINIRSIGILTVFFSVLLLFIKVLYENKQQTLNNFKLFLVYMILFTLFYILFCPLWWTNTYSGPLFYLAFQKRIVFYLGESLPVSSLPWHYVPLWILVSTPIMYVFLFLMGCIATIKIFFNKVPANFTHKRNLALFILWFFVPLFLSTGKAYNTWRHFFFIYPALVIMSLTGFQYIWTSLKDQWHAKLAIILHSFLVLLLLLNLGSVALFMIKNHPFEEIYFNRLAGKDLKEAKANFELDYWGTSYKQALEHILKTDHSALIPVEFNFKLPGDSNITFLPKHDRERFLSVNDITKAKYLIVLNKKPDAFPFKQEYYSIKVQGVKILTVFRLY